MFLCFCDVEVSDGGNILAVEVWVAVDKSRMLGLLVC